MMYDHIPMDNERKKNPKQEADHHSKVNFPPFQHYKFDEKGKPHEQAAQVLKAMAKGKIPSDVGQLFITSISSMLNIQEKTGKEEDRFGHGQAPALPRKSSRRQKSTKG